MFDDVFLSTSFVRFPKSGFIYCRFELFYTSLNRFFYLFIIFCNDQQIKLSMMVLVCYETVCYGGGAVEVGAEVNRSLFLTCIHSKAQVD